MSREFFSSFKELNAKAREQALARQQVLTKPQGSLGLLEEIAVRLAAQQGKERPEIKQPWVSVFAADHGIAADGVSAYPQIVTQEMVKNFCRGGAAINVLANFSKAKFEVIDVGVLNDVGPLEHLLSCRVAAGSANFAKQPAMTEEQLWQAVQVGIEAAERAKASGADLFICGEMGIGNTSSATAICATLSGRAVSEIVGAGTGVNQAQKKHKAELIQQAIELHSAQLASPLKVLQYLGGLEIAAMCGAFIRSAQLGLPVIVDGAIASSALWIAELTSRNNQLGNCCSLQELFILNQDIKFGSSECISGLESSENTLNDSEETSLLDWCYFAHQSVEPVHSVILQSLGVEPLLNFNMRLGEGSGAALVIPLLQQACALHSQMTTFEQAGVSSAD